VHPLAALETEYSLWSRDVEKDILPACRELGIALMAYSPPWPWVPNGHDQDAGRAPAQGSASRSSALQSGQSPRNVALLQPLESIAAAHKVTPAQVALAWVLAQGQDVVPIRERNGVTIWSKNAAAAGVSLNAAEIARLAKTFPPGVASGTRYPEKQLAGLGI